MACVPRIVLLLARHGLLFQVNDIAGAERTRQPRQPVASAERSRTRSPDASAADAMDSEDAVSSSVRGPSKREQRSKARSAEFHRRRRVRDRMRHLLGLFVKRWRHERLWLVHNAWYPTWVAARSAAAAAAAPTALRIERMDEGRGLAAAPAEQEGMRPSHGLDDGARASVRLNPAALEFVPGLSMAEVERRLAPQLTSGTSKWVVWPSAEKLARLRARKAAREEARRAKAATVKALSAEGVNQEGRGHALR